MRRGQCAAALPRIWARACARTSDRQRRQDRRSGATASTIPASCHEAAGRLSPERIALVARAAPARSGSSTQATGGNTPSVISGRPNVAVSAAKMKSHASASSKPPPRQRPRTTAAVGAGNSRSAAIIACVAGSTRAIGSGACSGMLAPNEKSGPAPSIVTSLRCLQLRQVAKCGVELADDLCGQQIAGIMREDERRARAFGVQREMDGHRACVSGRVGPAEAGPYVLTIRRVAPRSCNCWSSAAGSVTGAWHVKS